MAFARGSRFGLLMNKRVNILGKYDFNPKAGWIRTAEVHNIVAKIANKPVGEGNILQKGGVYVLTGPGIKVTDHRKVHAVAHDALYVHGLVSMPHVTGTGELVMTIRLHEELDLDMLPYIWELYIEDNN